MFWGFEITNQNFFCLLNMKRLTWLAAVMVLQFSLLNAQLVFPGAEGFGAAHRSAYSGSAQPRILVVNSLLDNNQGSEAEGKGTLRWCLTRSYPRIVLFEVGGTIHLDDILEIEDPYLLVAGQTAPSPGILVTTSTVVIRTHHVLFQHLSFRAGDDPDGSKPESRDCIAIFTGDCHDITIDHCSMLWGIDENFSTWGIGDPINNITVSNCIIAQALNYSISPDGGHSKGLLIGYATRNISILKNLIAHNWDRNPLLQGGTESEVINNLIYNTPNAVSYNSYDELVTESSVINNLIVPGYDDTGGDVARFILMNNSSRVYLSGNTDTDNDWDYISGTSMGEQVRVDDPPLSSGRAELLPRDQVESYILQNVGSRPWERSAADQQVLDDYENGTGRIVDCVDGEEILYNEGTAVSATKNTITLDPSDPGTQNRAYEFKSIEILGGSGVGQRRDVASFNHESNLLTVIPDWDVVPDGSSTYTMIVNCGNNAGGWHLLESSRVVPDIPDDPHGDSNANGYSNLEEWLHTINPQTGLDQAPLGKRYTLYPNPSGGSLTLEFVDQYMVAAAVNITSLLGARVVHIQLDHTGPGDSLQIDVSQMQKGIYVVGVQYSDQVVSQKLVVL